MSEIIAKYLVDRGLVRFDKNGNLVTDSYRLDHWVDLSNKLFADIFKITSYADLEKEHELQIVDIFIRYYFRNDNEITIIQAYRGDELIVWESKVIMNYTTNKNSWNVSIWASHPEQFDDFITVLRLVV